MICDDLRHAGFYRGLGEPLQFALDYLRDHSMEEMEPGRYEIRGDDMYLLIQQYESRKPEEGFWEAHRKYIDIQLMVRGAERMGVAPASRLTVSREYSEDKDFMVLEGQGDMLTVREGSFVVFFPQDAHMPCLAVQNPEPVKKAVMKIRMAQEADQ